MTTLIEVTPDALHEHPDQRRVYGEIGGEHDGAFADLCARIEQTKTITPVIVARDTPGLRAWTIISGHRRRDAARKLGMPLPVVFVDYADETEAKAAFLALNEQREKNEWVKTQEAEAWREVERERAGKRMRAGVAAPSGASAGGSKGEVREIVAKKLNEGAKTTDLRFKLAEKAREQNPARPDESPVAKALKENRPVKTVAREVGIVKPDAAKERKARFDVLLDDVSHATTHAALTDARARVETLDPALSAKERDGLESAYAAALKRINAKPAAARPVANDAPPARAPRPDVMAPFAGLKWCRELHAAAERFREEWRALLARRPVSSEARTATESEATTLIEELLNELPDDARTTVATRLVAIQGGK